MSCKVSKFDICHLKIETWKPYEIAFPADIDISTDKFTYRVYRDKFLKLDKELTPENGKVIITDPSLDFGKYAHELIWNHNGFIYVVFRGQLEITNYSEFGCSSCTDDSRNIVIDASEKCVNVSVGIIGNTGGSGGGTFLGIVTDNTNKSVTLSGNGLQGTELSAEVKIDNDTLKKRTDGTLYSTATGGGITEVVTGTSGNVIWQGKGIEEDPLEGLVDLSNLVVKEAGKGLSTNDYTTAEKTKLAGLSNYNLTTASATTKGGVKIPTTSSISISSENIDVKIDGTTITKGSDGTLSAVGSGGSGGATIIEYTHTGNKEVAVSSINYTTNTLTSNGHALANGTRVAFNRTIDCNILTQTPFNDGWNIDNNGGGWFVVNSTTNTFQLSLTTGGSPIVLTERATNDFSKWKIEVMPSEVDVEIRNLNATNLVIDIVGATFRNTRYLLNNASIYSGYRTRNGETTVSGMTISDSYNLTTTNCIKINVVNGMDYIESIDNSGKLVGGKINSIREVSQLLPIRTIPITNIPSLKFNQLKPMNGTRIIIQKLK